MPRIKQKAKKQAITKKHFEQTNASYLVALFLGQRNMNLAPTMRSKTYKT
jgi:hypothetical protein